MVVGGSQNLWPQYRCPPTGDCTRKAAISAEKIEGIVTEAVREALARAEGRASVASKARDAERELAQAQSEVDAVVAALGRAGLADEPAAVERLTELRDARDAAQERVDELGASRLSVTVNADRDWDRFMLDERRALIRAVVERVTVAPGRGPGRVTVQLVGE